MNELEALFCSRTRAGILTCLFDSSPAKLHLRALSRETGMSVGSVRQDVNKLIVLGLVVSERDGNRTYYSANPKHPLHPALRELVIRTTGLYGILQEHLRSPDIQYAFVFGSTSAGSATSSSDIDLMVIGALGLRKLASQMSSASLKIGREVNAHAMTLDDYLSRCAGHDHFITTILQAPRHFILGDVNELEKLERQRMDQGTSNL
jgi:predicted nucleotidyltransferase